VFHLSTIVGMIGTLFPKGGDANERYVDKDRGGVGGGKKRVGGGGRGGGGLNGGGGGGGGTP